VLTVLGLFAKMPTAFIPNEARAMALVLFPVATTDASLKRQTEATFA